MQLGKLALPIFSIFDISTDLVNGIDLLGYNASSAMLGLVGVRAEPVVETHPIWGTLSLVIIFFPGVVFFIKICLLYILDVFQTKSRPIRTYKRPLFDQFLGRLHPLCILDYITTLLGVQEATILFFFSGMGGHKETILHFSISYTQGCILAGIGPKYIQYDP